MRAIAVADPFTYAVHAFKCLLLKNTGLSAISTDLLYLTVFTAIAMTASIKLFRRTL
jgi:ABC-2 type transport system permease protein